MRLPVALVVVIVGFAVPSFRGALALILPSVKIVQSLTARPSRRTIAIDDFDAVTTTTKRIVPDDDLPAFSVTTNSLIPRRHVIFHPAAAAVGLSVLSHGAPSEVYAETTTPLPVVDEVPTTNKSSSNNNMIVPVVEDMKTFLDPQGMFAINVPTRFFAIRRSAKGDLPNAKGQGRRGSTIFTAGDMSKAEVVAIERFPTEILLLDNGIIINSNTSTEDENNSSASQRLDLITDIGEIRAVANLLALKRDRDKDGTTLNTKVIANSCHLSNDQQELTFQLRTKIDVQRPELLFEETGSTELYRITAAKASLQAGNGIMMVVYASALETDWNGPDGLALQAIVQSFTVLA